MKDEQGISHILRDRKLARLGDAYINFTLSLALSRASGRPQGVKVSDRILAEASRRAGIREMLPSRTARRDSANAMEALLVHGYLEKLISLEESVEILATNPDDPTGAIAALASAVIKRLNEKTRREGRS